MKAASRKGFTLIEILIVVIILGILAAIVIPQFTNASDDAKLSSVQSTVSSVQAQLELYKFQTSSTPTPATLWSLLGAKTAVDGKSVGPWIAAPAVNPFTSSSAIAADTSATGSWAYDAANNKFYGCAKGTWFPQQ